MYALFSSRSSTAGPCQQNRAVGAKLVYNSTPPYRRRHAGRNKARFGIATLESAQGSSPEEPRADLRKNRKGLDKDLLEGLSASGFHARIFGDETLKPSGSSNSSTLGGGYYFNRRGPASTSSSRAI